jgi:hypothetical protein
MGTVMDEIKVEKYSSYKDSGVDWLGEIPEIGNQKDLLQF